MHKPRLSISPTVKCIDCGFFGYREGGVATDGGTYLGSRFWECHEDVREKGEIYDSYVVFSDDGSSWNVIGCFHRVWSLWGSRSKEEREKAKKILTEERQCKYYFPYQSGYEPAGHNEMRRDKRNQRVILFVGLINAAAIILAAVITGMLRG